MRSFRPKTEPIHGEGYIQVLRGQIVPKKSFSGKEMVEFPFMIACAKYVRVLALADVKEVMLSE